MTILEYVQQSEHSLSYSWCKQFGVTVSLWDKSASITRQWAAPTIEELKRELAALEEKL
ncbi:MAG: hypothetical protein GY941_22410 [Planctomycetes bacterium]|nr:hypothetical protein [Planctomycetota bacterium]